MNYIAKRAEPLSAEELAVYKEFGFSEKFSRLLYIRGIDTADKIKNFFDFSEARLHDPFLMKGMSDAVNRINTAISKKERILIIGDYDCDGICATAILYKYLLTRYAQTRYFLPNRDADGYGLTRELVGKLNDRFKPNLIITVDCGISCYNEIEYAKSLGIDCIVTDHHAIPEKTPDCICVNPKFVDQEYPFSDLCGAGVSLKLVQALAANVANCSKIGTETALKYVDICSVATVADIVSLTDENRVIVALGLERINANSNPAITALSKSCNVFGQIKSTDISFKLGPKINAAGRLGNAKRGLDLLLEKDEVKIAEIIQSLDDYNKERQKLCNTICEQAEEFIEKNNLADNNIIIVYDDKWDGGVLGIVAARIVDKYNKPTIVLSKSESVYKGSARSINSVDIVEVITKFSHYLTTFGGHSMAGGLSVNIDVFGDFVRDVTDYMNSIDLCDTASDKMYDFELELDDMSLDFVREVEKLEPFGCENQLPVFMTNVGQVLTQGLANYPAHLRFTAKCENKITSVSFMFFDGAKHIELLQDSSNKKIIFEFQKTLETKSKNDHEILKAIVKGIIPIPTDDKTYALALAGELRGDFCLNNERLDEIKKKLVVDRDTFVQYYKIIKKGNGRRVFGLYDFYTKVKNEDTELFQFVFCCVVFMQLGILNFEKGIIRLNTNVNTELGTSSIYRVIQGD
ncbi:MAG: single-stranded-DNA-specific exonuclease RecJ [Firmicutes bacterium]|nr:single-stranded-DNA-specific exonuclease RecJ [Bacillota bacterium]